MRFCIQQIVILLLLIIINSNAEQKERRADFLSTVSYARIKTISNVEIKERPMNGAAIDLGFQFKKRDIYLGIDYLFSTSERDYATAMGGGVAFMWQRFYADDMVGFGIGGKAGFLYKAHEYYSEDLHEGIYSDNIGIVALTSSFYLGGFKGFYFRTACDFWADPIVSDAFMPKIALGVTYRL